MDVANLAGSQGLCQPINLEIFYIRQYKDHVLYLLLDQIVAPWTLVHGVEAGDLNSFRPPF